MFQVFRDEEYGRVCVEWAKAENHIESSSFCDLFDEFCAHSKHSTCDKSV